MTERPINLRTQAITHADLVAAAVRWLRGKGCRVVLHEPFRAAVSEQPDAIGWRDGISLMVEAKASRRDFLVDARKQWRILPETGVGDWRMYITPPSLLERHELPPGWGLVEFDGTRCAVIAGLPKGNTGWSERPFNANKRNETVLLVSALAQPHCRTDPKVARRGIAVAGAMP